MGTQMLGVAIWGNLFDHKDTGAEKHHFGVPPLATISTLPTSRLAPALLMHIPGLACQHTGSYHDAVVDGVLYRGIPDRVIFVESESDLDDLTGELPGTVAMLYDETSKWRWDGTDWTEVGGVTEG